MGMFPNEYLYRYSRWKSAKTRRTFENCAGSVLGAREALRSRKLAKSPDMILLRWGSFSANIYTNIRPGSVRKRCGSSKTVRKVSEGYARLFGIGNWPHFRAGFRVGGEVAHRIFIPIFHREVFGNPADLRKLCGKCARITRNTSGSETGRISG